MDLEKIDKIIEFLEAVLKLPKMYFGSEDNTKIASSYLSGIRHGALTVLDTTETIISSWHEAILRRGHRLTPRNTICSDMNEKGFENMEIVKELIQIEIETWKIFRESLTD